MLHWLLEVGHVPEICIALAKRLGRPESGNIVSGLPPNFQKEKKKIEPNLQCCTIFKLLRAPETCPQSLSLGAHPFRIP